MEKVASSGSASSSSAAASTGASAATATTTTTLSDAEKAVVLGSYYGRRVVNGTDVRKDWSGLVSFWQMTRYPRSKLHNSARERALRRRDNAESWAEYHFALYADQVGSSFRKRFEVLAFLGHGGNAYTLKCRKRASGALVAVKVNPLKGDPKAGQACPSRTTHPPRIQPSASLRETCAHSARKKGRPFLPSSPCHHHRHR